MQNFQNCDLENQVVCIIKNIFFKVFIKIYFIKEEQSSNRICLSCSAVEHEGQHFQGFRGFPNKGHLYYKMRTLLTEIRRLLFILRPKKLYKMFILATWGTGYFESMSHSWTWGTGYFEPMSHSWTWGTVAFLNRSGLRQAVQGIL